jgi:DNA-binding NarL/FixJ family response regulator
MDHITTLLLVDGDSGALRGLRMRLALEPDLRVVGEARWEDDLAAIAAALAPDVVVLDLDRPRSGATAPGCIRALAADHRVVAISLHDDRATAAAMHADGVAAFVGKHEGVAHLLAAIRSSAGGAERAPPME